MRGSGITPNTSIRINPDVLHKARIAAVTVKLPLGKWLEQAIEEKLKRDQTKEKHDKRRG